MRFGKYLGRGRTSNWIHKWPLVAIFGIVSIAYGSVLFGGKTLSTSSYTFGVFGNRVSETGEPHLPVDGYRLDAGSSSWQFEPWARVTSEAYRQFDPPVWNQYQGLGVPLLGNMQSSALDPVMMPVFLNPTLLMWDLVMIGSVLLSMSAMYFLAFRLISGRLGSFVASISFGLSGFFFLYNNNSFMRTYLYTPLLCLATHIALNSKHKVQMFLISVVVYLVIAVGMPESFFLVFVTTTAFGLWSALNRDSTRPIRERLIRLSVGYIAGILLSAPILLSFLEYERNSEHSHGSNGESATAVDPIRLLLKIISPFATGLPSSPLPGLSGTRGWLGVSVLTLSFIGLLSRLVPRGLQATLGLLAAFPIWKVFGFPGSDLLARLPIFERINYPVWALPTLIFPVALLAGFGIRWIQVSEKSSRRSIVGAAIVTSVFLLLIERNWVEIRQITHAQLVIGLGFSMSLILLWWALLSWPLRSRARFTSFAMLTIFELLVLAPLLIYPTRVDPFKEPSWLDTVKRQQGTENLHRVFAFDGLLFPNTAATLGLRDVRMLDALYVDRTWRYIKTFIEPEIRTRFIGGSFAREEFTPAWIENNPMFDVLGIKTVVTAKPIPDTPILELSRDFSKLTNVSVQAMTVNQQTATALFFSPPGRVVLPESLLEAADEISFRYGLDDQAYRDSNADGVDFVVRKVGASELEFTELWRDTIVPTFNSDNAGWRDASIPLPTLFDSKKYNIVVSVEPRGNSSTDWAGVTDVRSTGLPFTSSPTSQFRLTHVSNGTFVYENRHATTGLTVATRVFNASSEDDAIKVFEKLSVTRLDGSLEVHAFDPRRDVVIERQASRQMRQCSSNQSPQATLLKVSSLEIKAKVVSDCDGVAVFATAYYPGWRAVVNGKSAEVLPSNIALIGVPIKAGESEITLVYQPNSFRRGVFVSLLTLIAMLGVVWTLSRSESRLKDSLIQILRRDSPNRS